MARLPGTDKCLWNRPTLTLENPFNRTTAEDGFPCARMKKRVKYILNLFYKPFLVKYLSVTRTYRFRGIRLLIPTEVFHPGFFFSTRLLLRHLDRYPMKERSLLELGAGSGLISFFAARKGAVVTASDINPVAVEYLIENSRSNRIPIRIFHSDLFSGIPKQSFDIIAINPPYYRRQPVGAADYAWYCGENGEYFNGLFAGLGNYTHPLSLIWIILCDGCDMALVKELAAGHGWKLECVSTSSNLVEKNFIFRAGRPGKEESAGFLPGQASREAN
jgi:release factor glutamine methyltransferase